VSLNRSNPRRDQNERAIITAEDVADTLEGRLLAGDSWRKDAAALIRALEQVRVVAEALHFKADRDGHPVLIGMLQLAEALTACEKAMGERE